MISSKKKKKMIRESVWRVSGRGTDAARIRWRVDRLRHQQSQKVWKPGGDRHSNKEIFKRIENSSVTLFVDNLPLSMTTSWLWQLCGLEGEVVDMYISRKKRQSNPLPFAFVRFSNKSEALKAIRNMSGMKIRGCSLELKEAKYKRAETRTEKGDDGDMKNNTMQVNGRLPGNKLVDRTFRDVVVNNNKNSAGCGARSCAKTKATRKEKNMMNREAKTIVVYGEINEVTMEKLSRSLIGESLFPVIIEDMAVKLFKDWFT